MMYPQETDEEMERRLLAEINARSSGGSAEDVDFAGLIGSMADPSLSAPSDGPAEVAPPQQSAPAMDTGRLATFQETFGEAEPAEMPELPAARQPAGQARYGGMMPAFDDAQMPDRSSQFDRQLADLDRQAQRERRRRGIFGALLSPLLHDRTDEFVGQNQDQYAARRADIVQRRNRMQEEQSRRQRERRQALLQQLDAQRRQASEDRRYELDRGRLDELRRYNDARLEDADARIAQGAERVQHEADRVAQGERRTALQEQRAAARGAAGGGSGPRPVQSVAGPRGSIVHLPGDPDDQSIPSEDREARRADLAEYMDQHRRADPEMFDAIREANPGASDYELALEMETHSGVWGRTTGRRGADRSRSIRTIRAGSAQRTRERAAGDRFAATQARAGHQRDQRAVPYDEQAEFAEEAAAALERIAERTGDMGARVIRGDNLAADAASALAGTDVETDRATFRDFLSNLLHERGGASLTPQEKAAIQQALASGSLLTSSEATVRTLRNIAARARRRAQQERRGSGQRTAAPAQSSGGGETVLGSRVINGVTHEMVRRADGTTYVRRAQ